MIVRIQTEGQWELSHAQTGELDKIDNELVGVLEKQDAKKFEQLMNRVHEYVRGKGRALKPDEIMESDLILPPADATMDEVKQLFAGEGIIPG